MSGDAGVPPGLGGFGDVGEARKNFNTMVPGMGRLKEISENVEGDQLNLEKYVKELTYLCMEVFKPTGTILEQKHLRFINMFIAAVSGGISGRGLQAPQGHHGAQGHPELASGEWRQVHFSGNDSKSSPQHSDKLEACTRR